MSEMVTLWLVVLIVSIGVEVATLGLTSIWFAGGAVVAVIAAHRYLSDALQIVDLTGHDCLSADHTFHIRPYAVFVEISDCDRSGEK